MKRLVILTIIAIFAMAYFKDAEDAKLKTEELNSQMQEWYELTIEEESDPQKLMILRAGYTGFLNEMGKQ